MEAWVLLLRGINVGGRNVLPMKDLRAALEGAGFARVRTALQSGNVVALAPGDAAAVAARAEAAVLACSGIDARVFAMPPQALGRALADGPFAVEGMETPNRVHLWFPFRSPAEGAQARLEALRAPHERIALREGILHLHAPLGIGRSRLAAGVERALGTPATARSLATLAKLVIAAAEAG